MNTTHLFFGIVAVGAIAAAGYWFWAEGQWHGTNTDAPTRAVFHTAGAYNAAVDTIRRAQFAPTNANGTGIAPVFTLPIQLVRPADMANAGLSLPPGLVT